MTPTVSPPLRAARMTALLLLAGLTLAASAAAFAESYTGLYLWALEHGYAGWRARAWPLMVDTFIAGPELTLFLALIDQWRVHARLGAWAVCAVGLTVSVGGNVGHVATVDWLTRASAAVPPLAAAASLWLGLAVLKRVVTLHHRATAAPRRPWLRALAHRPVARWRWHRFIREVDRARAAYPPAPGRGTAVAQLLPAPVLRIPVAAIPVPALPRQCIVAVPPVPPRPVQHRRATARPAAPQLAALPGGAVPRPGPVLLPPADTATTPEARAAHAYRVSLSSPGRPLSQRALADQYLGGNRHAAKRIIDQARQPARAAR